MDEPRPTLGASRQLSIHALKLWLRKRDMIEHEGTSHDEEAHDGQKDVREMAP
jgi:hypothetical protein